MEELPTPEKPQLSFFTKILIGFAIFFIVLFSLTGNHGSDTSASNRKSFDNPEMREEAQWLIARSGYRCDSIESVTKAPFKVGFRFTCNGGRYAYTITDEGGRMVVALD